MVGLDNYKPEDCLRDPGILWSHQISGVADQGVILNRILRLGADGWPNPAGQTIAKWHQKLSEALLALSF